MDYKDINDYELIYMVRENDEDSYNLLFDKYKPLISKTAISLYRRFSDVGLDYNDLCQEGMLGLYEALKRYDFDDNTIFYSFAYMCIKRRMNNIIKKSISSKNIILNSSFSYNSFISDDETEYIDILYDTDDFLEKKYYLNLNRKDFLDLKYELKDIYAPVFELKLNGFSNSDIATLLNIKYKDVDNYIRSIKLTLRKKINNSPIIDFSVL